MSGIYWPQWTWADRARFGRDNSVIPGSGCCNSSGSIFMAHGEGTGDDALTRSPAQRSKSQMKHSSKILAGLLVAFAATSASAQTATQTVTFQVDAINLVGVTGTPSLVINTASAGSAPTSATSAGNTW